MRNVLITGGAGFIGANFTHYLSRTKPELRLCVVDALTYAGNIKSLESLIDAGRIAFFKGDICDQAFIERILRDQKIDTIVHFAAESHVDRSIRAPDIFLQTNIFGTQTLLKTAYKVWIQDGLCAEHRFHHISTDEVFGDLSLTDPPFTEETQYQPNSPYAASKAASDHLVRAYNKTFGLKVTTSNCSNNYGPYHFPEKLIPLCITNILRGLPLPVYGDGLNVRDWLHVEDHCRAIHLVLEQGVVGETYNVGGNSEMNNITLVTTLCEKMDVVFAGNRSLAASYPECPPAKGKSCAELIHYVDDRLGHDRRYAILADKIRNELGFEPTLQLDQGLDLTIQWYLDHPEWWEPLLA